MEKATAGNIHVLERDWKLYRQNNFALAQLLQIYSKADAQSG